MQIVAEFDPNAKVTDTFATNLSNGIGKIIIWNESNWTIDITFTNGDVDIAPAWTATIFELTGPAGKLTWTQDTQLAANIPPLSKVWVVAYRNNETIPGVFPVALVRQTNIGNASTVVAATTSVQNDGNVAGTSILEAKVVGDGSSAVTLSNDALFVLGDVAHPGSFTTAGNIVANGGMNINTIRDDVNGNTALDLSAGTGAVTFPQKITANGVAISGNTTVGFDASGLTGGTALKLLLGSLGRISTFSGTTSTTPTFFNHGLGAIPDFVFITLNGTSATAHSIFVDFSTITSVHVKLTSDGNNAFVGLAIAF